MQRNRSHAKARKLADDSKAHPRPFDDMGERLQGAEAGTEEIDGVISMLGEIDVESVESLAEAGTMLGSAGVMVLDETVCMVGAAYNLARFYQHESCGQCTPCRQGTYWMLAILHRIEHGAGTMEDLSTLLDICDNIEGNTICPLGDAAVPPVRSTIRNFREEYEYHITHKSCMPGTTRARFE